MRCERKKKKNSFSIYVIIRKKSMVLAKVLHMSLCQLKRLLADFAFKLNVCTFLLHTAFLSYKHTHYYLCWRGKELKELNLSLV